MQLSSILNQERSFCGDLGSSKKRVLENISEIIAKTTTGLDDNELFDKIIERERLGSTGIGLGFAIPHCRLSSCRTVVGSLFKLDEAIDFDAIDGQPVDLIFVLIVPEEAQDEHLKALAIIAEQFNDPNFCQQLRDCKDQQQLYLHAIGKLDQEL